VSTGLYIHITRSPGTIVDAPLYNTAHRNHLDNDIPASCGAHSDDLTMFRATSDPYLFSTAQPEVALGTELEQLRFVIANIKETIAGSPPAFWYTPATGSLSGGTIHSHGANVFKTVGQSLTTKTQTAIVFDAVNYDTGVILPTFDPFFSVSHPTRLSAPVAGIYQINAWGTWGTGPTSGNLALFLRFGGTKLLSAIEYPINQGSLFRWQSLGTQYHFTAGQYVELIGFQTTGGPLTITTPTLTMTLIAPDAPIPAEIIHTLTVTESGTGTGTVTSTPGVINFPGVDHDSYVSGSVVSLAATPDMGSVFTQWTNVPAGHEMDNPVSVTVTTDVTVDAQFDSAGKRFVMPTFLTDSVDDGGGTTAYTGLGWNAGFLSTEAAAHHKLLQDITINSWTVQMPAALPGGETLTFTPMVNGAAQPLWAITLGAGDTGGRFDGTIALLAGDTLSIRGVASSPTSAALIVNGFMFACTSASPVVATTVFPNSANYKIAPEGSAGNGQNAVAFGLNSFEASFCPMPTNQIFSALSAQFPAAHTGTIQPRVGGSNTGAALAYTAVDNATGAVAFTLARPTSGATFLTDYGDMNATGLSGAGSVRVMAAYAMDTGFENWCVLTSGQTFSASRIGLSSGSVGVAQAVGGNFARADTAIAVREAEVQLRWPNLQGTLQYFTAISDTGVVSTPYTIAAEVRVNGATAIAAPLTPAVSANTGEVVSEDGSSVTVFVDDLVNFGATASTFDTFNGGSTMLYGVGFLPA
jgi:hypothetical protein